MQKIRLVSRLFRWFFQAAFAIIPLLLIIFWFNAPTPFGLHSIGLGNLDSGFVINFIPKDVKILHPLSTHTKWLGFLISLIPTIIHLLVLYFLIKLFRLYEQNTIFSLKNVNLIKKIGYTLLLGQLLTPVHQALMSAALTWHNPPGLRYAAISLSGTNVGIILIALLIILVSWVMAEGYKLKDEQEYTI